VTGLHLGHVGVGVECIALGELPVEHDRETLRDRGLAAARHPHHDDDVWRSLVIGCGLIVVDHGSTIV
jgi:hypothetical protein